MYRSLHTNLPSVLMSLRGFPFPDECPSFPSHSDVHAYLRAFAAHHSLTDVIRFGTTVKSVEPADSASEFCAWKVQCEQGDAEMEAEKFDFVAVCNGHYSNPVRRS